jgi:hypothetical protein
VVAPERLRAVGESAWTWVLAHVGDDDGPWLPEWVRDDVSAEPNAEERDFLYCGIAGLAPALREIGASRDLEPDEVALARGVVERLRRVDADGTDASLYFGLAGHAAARRMLGDDVDPVVERILSLVDARGWPSSDDALPYLNDVIDGTAGIVMTGVWLGSDAGDELARVGADRLIGAAQPAPGGLWWTMAEGYPSRMPNFSHGTAGVAAALAVAGERLGSDDLVDAAVRGARHLLTIADLADDGFRLPLVIPPQDNREPYSYGWCHGPLATSQLFTALESAGVTDISGRTPDELRRRCVTSVLRSGIPERLHPGFWDNDGRCCGTAGVGDLLLDLAQGCGDPAYADQLLAAAVVMGDAILERAITDDVGTRWRFVEHRDEDPLLAPNTSWMQGAAGMAAFLLRLARVLEQGLDAPVVTRPDQFWAIPETLRAS